jgi:peptidoglycan/LPS O-acetylase OafA/YrhL
MHRPCATQEEPLVEPDPTAAGTGHRNNFDALRLLGALLVLVNHSMELTGHRPFLFAGNAISTLGVKLFFVISGYLVTTSWLRDSHAGRYALRRARRIMPALALVVLAWVFVLGPLFSSVKLHAYAGSPLTLRYLGNLVFHVAYALPGVFTSNPIPNAVNGSLWTLPIEVAMYIAVPLLLLTGRWRILAVPAAFAAAAAGSLHLLRGGSTPLVIYGTELWTALLLVPYFVAGLVVAWFRLERFLDWRIGVLVLVGLNWAGGHLGVWSEAGLWIALPWATLAVGLRRWPVLNRAGRWGDFSYGLYLWGFPAQQAVIAVGGAAWTGWWNLALAGPVGLGCAVLSWHAVERRALSWRPFGLRPRRARQATPAVAALDARPDSPLAE